jgi:hypothetical protein
MKTVTICSSNRFAKEVRVFGEKLNASSQLFSAEVLESEVGRVSLYLPSQPTFS